MFSSHFFWNKSFSFDGIALEFCSIAIMTLGSNVDMMMLVDKANQSAKLSNSEFLF